MANKKEFETVETVEKVSEKVVERYKGWQLLQLPKYRNRIARYVLDADKEYSYEEADKAIETLKDKKG